jgi:hypothetical protein
MSEEYEKEIRFARDKVKNKIKSLQALVNDKGATNAEKENALSRLKFLCEKYSILESELKETAEVGSEKINYPFPVYTNWQNLLISALVDSYNCTALSQYLDDGHGRVHYLGVAIFGIKKDLDMAVKVVDYIFTQALDKADNLYQWAKELFNTKDPIYGVYKVNQKYQISDSLFGDVSFSALDAYNMRHAMRHFNKMPQPDSHTWSLLESDWGNGLVGSILLKIVKLQKEFEQSNPFETDSDLNMLKNVKNTNQLMVLRETVNQDHRNVVKDFIEQNINKNDVKLEINSIEHNFLFNQGKRAGNVVEVTVQNK